MYYISYKDEFKCEELRVEKEDKYNLTFSVDGYVRFISKNYLNRAIKEGKLYYIVCDDVKTGMMRCIFMEARCKSDYYMAVANKVKEDYLKWEE